MYILYRWENTAWKPDDECLKGIHKHAPLSQFSYKGRNDFHFELHRLKCGLPVEIRNVHFENCW